MDDLSFFLLAFPVAAVAGLLGGILGIGGGIIIIPFLVLFMNVPVQYAIAAGIVSVIATSTASSIAHLKDGATNLKLAMFLESGTVAGALIGAILASRLGTGVLEILFALVLFYSAISMFLIIGRFRKAENDSLAQRMGLDSHYHDHEGVRQEYGVTNTAAGLLGSICAGAAACMFGIGGGVIKVPLMNQVMGVPMRAAAATSNFTIGVTAATGALVYSSMGYVVPQIVAPIALGVSAGSVAGAHLAKKAHPDALRALFVIILLYAGVRMALSGMGGAS